MENLEGEVEAEESALIGAAGGICFVKLFDLKNMSLSCWQFTILWNLILWKFEYHTNHLVPLILIIKILVVYLFFWLVENNVMEVLVIF